MAEFEKYKNPPKANFVISKKVAGEEGAQVWFTAQNQVYKIEGNKNYYADQKRTELIKRDKI